ncbi:MAG: hypothetical protein LAT76_10040 [Schleiferiaceae bacterium]|nr:hypothetical protein [Schleiferiaceae bacterium]
MVFIPKEAQEKIQALEAANKKLQEDLAALESQQLQSASKAEKPKGGNGGWLALVVLLLIALGVTQYLNPVWQKGDSGATISNDSLNVLQAELARFQDFEALNTFKKEAGASDVKVYRVQIGAYKGNPVAGNEPNLDELYFNKSGDFEAVSLGTFTNLERAQVFQNICVEMGLSGAYVVAFKNGKMQPLIEAKAK